MPVTLFCPICNVKVDVPERLAGKSAPCPVCRNLIDIPLNDKSGAAGQYLRRLLAAAPWLAAGVVAAGLLAESLYLSDLREANESLRRDLRALRDQLTAQEAKQAIRDAAPSAPAAALPAPAAPVQVTPDERADFQRMNAELREALGAQTLQLRRLENEIARLKGEAAAATETPETAADEDIEAKVSVKADTAGPRIKFTFEGRATNTGKKPAPTVEITVNVTQIQGLHPLNNDVVSFVPQTATLRERLRNLVPGESRAFWLELMPNDPGLLRRDLTWQTQHTVSAHVTRE